jgi:hypothetical protein
MDGKRVELKSLRDSLIQQGAVAAPGNALNVPQTNYVVIKQNN